MAHINKSLDEIIGRRGGGSRRIGGGGGTRRFASGGRNAGSMRSDGALFSSQASTGKWKHDKFREINSGKRRGVGGGKQLKGDFVKLNISNLPATVITADLEELFAGFSVYGVSVHYNELGEHLGTADLMVDTRSAKDIMREYSNIAIDGQALKFAVVDESGKLPGGASIKDRIQRLNRRSDPIRRRREQLPSKKKRTSAGASAGEGRGRRAGGGGAGKTGAKKEVMTADELDKQLEAYMGSRHPAIQQP